MRILTVILFLMFTVANTVFSAGTVILNETGDSFPDGWFLYQDELANAFTKQSWSSGNPCIGFTAPPDVFYKDMFKNKSSYAERNISILGYDAAAIQFIHRANSAFQLKLQYFDTTWHDIATINSTAEQQYGPYELPVNASKVILSIYFQASFEKYFLIDNLQVIAEKRPTLTLSGKAGYATDGVEPNVAKTVEPFIFQIKYTDSDNDAPSYMRLHILNEGAEISGSPFSMNHVEGSYATGALYSKELKFSTGTYTYYFDTSDGWLSDTTAADQKRFDVINVDPPPLPFNVSPKASNGATVTSNIVELAWAQSANDPYGVSYTVLLSTGTDRYFAPSRTPSIFKTVYTGPATSLTLTNLLPGTQYNWQVEATNGMGVKTTSPLYSFMTLAKPASIFNYPNPFNPVRQPTTIVYDVDTAQDVKIKIYSEYGSLVFEDTHSALPGSNEYRYDGKDNTGKTLYNGSYVCRIESSRGTSTCYLLIVK